LRMPELETGMKFGLFPRELQCYHEDTKLEFRQWAGAPEKSPGLAEHLTNRVS
jgi:hypothetical protein